MLASRGGWKQKDAEIYTRHALVIRFVVQMLGVVNARHGVEQSVAVSPVAQGEQSGCKSRTSSSPRSKPHAFDKQVWNRYKT